VAEGVADPLLIGITTGAQCGIDIEGSRAGISEQSIGESFFCPREIQWLRQTEKGSSGPARRALLPK